MQVCCIVNWLQMNLAKSNSLRSFLIVAVFGTCGWFPEVWRSYYACADLGFEERGGRKNYEIMVYETEVFLYKCSHVINI